MVDLGTRLKTLRTSKGLTQAELANRLGLTKSMISSYEMGTRKPSYSILVRLAGLFNVTTDFLLGADGKHGIDISGLSETNAKLILGLVYALQEKQLPQ